MFDLNALMRTNIRALKPYSSARSEFVGVAEVYLDANENAFGSPAGAGMNRYPDPFQSALKLRLGEMLRICSDQIFVGNGSDEAIDLLFRIFCEPGRDEVIICPPTYGMYRVSADINDVAVREVGLTGGFQLDVPTIMMSISDRTKLIFVCSPNNPTGNVMDFDSMVELARDFDGIVVVDEAYIHFSGSHTMAAELRNLPNLVVLQTFSKAWGMAGVRVGIAVASVSIIELMNRIKPPYNLSSLAQDAVLTALKDPDRIEKWTAEAVKERERMALALTRTECIEGVYPSDANFLLVRANDADAVYRFLINKKIVVRDRSKVQLCEGCLRITIGTHSENDRLIAALEEFDSIKRASE